MGCSREERRESSKFSLSGYWQGKSLVSRVQRGSVSLSSKLEISAGKTLRLPACWVLKRVIDMSTDIKVTVQFENSMVEPVKGGGVRLGK